MKKLKKLKEDVIVARILDLDARGIGAIRAIVEEIANNLLAARGEGPVSKHWVDRFRTRTKEVKL